MEIRRISTFVDEIRREMGKETQPLLRKVAAVAVVRNPLIGAYHEDLSELIEASTSVGREIAEIATRLLSPYEAQSYGKGAVVGLAGEQEHGVAMLTTVYGNVMREAVGGGRAWISSATKRAAPGTTIDVPLAHKDALYVRSHYDAITLTLHDAPLPDEIAIICAYASRGRPNPRVGGLAADEIKGQDGLV